MHRKGSPPEHRATGEAQDEACGLEVLSAASHGPIHVLCISRTVYAPTYPRPRPCGRAPQGPTNYLPCLSIHNTTAQPNCTPLSHTHKHAAYPYSHLRLNRHVHLQSHIAIT